MEQQDREKAEELSAFFALAFGGKVCSQTPHSYMPIAKLAAKKYYPKQRMHKLGLTQMCRRMQDYQIRKDTRHQEDDSCLASLKSCGKVHRKGP